jgi:hypothetical protein
MSVALLNQTVGVVYTGQVVASMLAYLCASAAHARALILSWQVVRAHHILVKWSCDAMIRDADQRLFDQTISLEFYGFRTNACNYTNPWSAEMNICRTAAMCRAVTAGVRAAYVRGCTYVLRIRIDIILEQWQLPPRIDSQCMYTYDHHLQGASPSDNVAFGPIAVIGAVFAPYGESWNRTALSSEQMVLHRAQRINVSLCYIPFSSWLVKPSSGSRQQRSSGVRHWYWHAGYVQITPHAKMPLATLPLRLTSPAQCLNAANATTPRTVHAH